MLWRFIRVTSSSLSCVLSEPGRLIHWFHQGPVPAGSAHLSSSHSHSSLFLILLFLFLLLLFLPALLAWPLHVVLPAPRHGQAAARQLSHPGPRGNPGSAQQVHSGGQSGQIRSVRTQREERPGWGTHGSFIYTLNRTPSFFTNKAWTMKCSRLITEYVRKGNARSLHENPRTAACALLLSLINNLIRSGFLLCFLSRLHSFPFLLSAGNVN